MTTTDSGTIERTITIEAPPETVYAFLTDPERIVEWMGRRIEADPRPGGTLRVDYNGFDIMRGEFLELQPYTRVVYTFGWESLDAEALKPGASRVEFTLTPEGSGTRLDFVHSGLPEMATQPFAEGWELFLGNLAARVRGESLEPMESELSEADELASRLNTLLIRAADIVERMDDAAWRAPVPGDGRPAGVVAYHVVGHLGMIDLAKGIEAGGPDPGLTLADIDAMNAEQARDHADTTREQVVTALRDEGPNVVTAVREMDAANLDRSMPMTFAGGNAVSVRGVLENMLLASTAGHVDELRAMLR